MSEQDAALVKSFGGVLAVLAIAAVGFYFVADSVTSEPDNVEGTNERMEAKILENIRPVGEVNVGAVPAAAATTAAAGPRSGQDVYNASCMACHSTGVAGAPKLGDKAAWSARAAKGVDGLLASAITGLNAMPPKGTCATCSDDELKGAIEFILKESGF